MNPTNVPRRPAATLALAGVTVDHQGDAWKCVPAGTCEKTASPTSPTGFGQLVAFKPVKKG